MSEDELERRTLTLFERLIDVPDGERDAWIREHTRNQPRLASRLHAMLQADRRIALHTGGAVATLAEEPQPERVGAYRIVERIGQGGMGSVYRGERSTGDFDHAVAIKIIKPGLLSDALIERFQRERQTLASLRHPHIAQLYDGGATDNGSPYIVMEYVEGLPLLAWLDRHDPDLDVRQRLFRDICGAVAFANQALVVHRDLTPSNVLVTDDGTVKLIDFGIARPVAHGGEATRPPLGSLSLTPGYAAPERMTSADVTTAADIYSLGRLLAHIIPDRASDDELRAIISRATASDPADRYPTADALSEDVDAWYRGFPVTAVGSQRFYIVRKFVGRHKISMISAALGLVLLIGALIAATVAYRQAETARQAEVERFNQLRSLANYMLFELNGRMERIAGSTGARADLTERAQAYLSALAATRHADDDLTLEIARGFIRLGQIQGLPTEPNLGERDKAKVNLQQAERLLTSLQSTAPGVVTALARARIHLAMIALHGDGDQEKATQLMEQAAAGLEAVAPAARDRDWRAVRAELQRDRVDMLLLSGQIDALPTQADGITADVDRWPQSEQGAAADFERAYAGYARGLALNNMGDPAAALPLLRQAEQQLIRLDQQSPNDPMILNLLAWLAYEGYGAGSSADNAEMRRFLALARRTIDQLTALESRDRSLRSLALNVRQAQAELLSRDGNHAAAITLQQEVIAGKRAAAEAQPSPATISRIALSQFILGNIALHANKRTLACEGYRGSAASYDKAKGLGPLLGRDETFQRKLASNVSNCASGGALRPIA